ncbi:MAG: glycine cleavage system aminomethyltransferase GcvT [Acholeplasmataceae bacterium]
MKQTPLFSEHIKLHAKITPFAGYEMPLFYDDISKEHFAVRHEVGIFDVSHMGEIYIQGDHALAFVNRIVTNQIDAISGKVTYSLLLNNAGEILDDLLVYTLSPNEFILVVNASNTDKDYQWILSQNINQEVTLKNISENWGQVAIQGPKSYEVVQSIFNHQISSLSFMNFMKLPYLKDDVIISRTGYTGEDGFEIYASPLDIITIWKKALTLGAKPCGLGARDTLRFQANLPLYGHEINNDIHPYISGLKFAVKTDKDFVGKTALLSNTTYLDKKLVGIELLEKNIPRQGYKVFKNDLEIGYITTGYLLPETNWGLALAIIDFNQATLGNEVEIEIRNKRVKAKVRNRKFLNKNYVK